MAKIDANTDLALD